MLKIKIIFLVLLVACLVLHFQQPGGVNPNPVDPVDPTPGGSIRVLIVEETSQRSKLPPAQVLALTAGDVRDYLNTHCDKDNGAAAWRIYDKDQDVTNESKEWQDELAVLKEQPLPAIAIKSGRRWSRPQPLPQDTDALLALLKKYGGK